MYECRHCGAVVNGEYGKVSPGEHQDRAGTRADPRAPGDHKECCDACCYGELRCAGERR